MLTRAATDTFAPHPKTTRLHVTAHDFYDLAFGKS